MARKSPRRPEGTLVVLEFESKVLADNPLGDPHVRKLAVWLPPAYDEGAGRGRGRRLPVLYDLVGFTGSGLAHINWRPFDENVPERVSRLVGERKMGPAILVFPDCFTCLGGNQYVNSSAIGRYADYLTREIVPLVDREFRTLASREHRGCFGKSSGGYGAMIHGMKYAKHWGAIADHSGDAYFDFCYMTDWPRTLNELDRYRKPPRRAGRIDVARDAKASGRGEDDGRVRRFLEAIWSKDKLNDAEAHALMMVAMAASYDADPRGAARLPAAAGPRDRRGDRGAVARLARARPDPPRRALPREPRLAAGHLHRLRLARPVPPALRRAHPVAASGAARHRASLRGVRRQPLVDRLPDGREPAVPLPRAQAMTVPARPPRTRTRHPQLRRT